MLVERRVPGGRTARNLCLTALFKDSSQDLGRVSNATSAIVLVRFVARLLPLDATFVAEGVRVVPREINMSRHLEPVRRRVRNTVWEAICTQPRSSPCVHLQVHPC